MKKITKIFGLGLAIGVLSMGMTVSAANSVAAGAGTLANSELTAQTTSVEATKDANGVTTTGTTSTAAVADVQSGYSVANNAATFKVVTGGAEAEAIVMDVVELNITATKADGTAMTAEEIKAGVEVAIACPAVKAGENYVVLHRKADGNWESVPVVSIVDGKIIAKFTSFSPVMVVKVKGEAASVAPGKSPKTGAALPVAGIMALVSLMGAAAFYKKARA